MQVCMLVGLILAADKRPIEEAAFRVGTMMVFLELDRSPLPDTISDAEWQKLRSEFSKGMDSCRLLSDDWLAWYGGGDSIEGRLQKAAQRSIYSLTSDDLPKTRSTQAGRVILELIRLRFDRIRSCEKPYSQVDLRKLQVKWERRFNLAQASANTQCNVTSVEIDRDVDVLAHRTDGVDQILMNINAYKITCRYERLWGRLERR